MIERFCVDYLIKCSLTVTHLFPIYFCVKTNVPGTVFHFHSDRTKHTDARTHLIPDMLNTKLHSRRKWSAQNNQQVLIRPTQYLCIAWQATALFSACLGINSLISDQAGLHISLSRGKEQYTPTDCEMRLKKHQSMIDGQIKQYCRPSFPEHKLSCMHVPKRHQRRVFQFSGIMFTSSSRPNKSQYRAALCAAQLLFSKISSTDACMMGLYDGGTYIFIALHPLAQPLHSWEVEMPCSEAPQKQLRERTHFSRLDSHRQIWQYSNLQADTDPFHSGVNTPGSYWHSNMKTLLH